MWIAHDIEEKVNIWAVDAGKTIEHDDLCISSVCFLEEILFKFLLFLYCWKDVWVVVLCEQPVPIIVKDGNAFDDVQSWFLIRRIQKSQSHEVKQAKIESIYNMCKNITKCIKLLMNLLTVYRLTGQLWKIIYIVNLLSNYRALGGSWHG